MCDFGGGGGGVVKERGDNEPSSNLPQKSETETETRSLHPSTAVVLNFINIGPHFPLSFDDDELSVFRVILTISLSVRLSTRRGSVFQGCQMAKFDPFLSLDCARVEGVGAQSKERKGSNFAA